MTTDPAKAEKRAKAWNETKMDLKWATALLLVLILTGGIFLPYLGLGPLGVPYQSWEREPAGEEDLSVVTQEIFAQDGLVAPFEVLSILLLAALIAGVVIALREPEGGI